jgi:aspartate kinase
MAGETNKLVALAKGCVDEPDPREMDVLLASGEQVTVALLAMRLIEEGIPAKSLLASQAQISTTSDHMNALIEEVNAERIRSVIADGTVAVVAGFQGVDDRGDLTTLGRGGSDITAVAVAAALNASACLIYTDVPGVFSTDPRMVPHAKLLARVSHEEMLEMASLGAKVLHTRSVYFAMRYRIPLAVLSTFAGPLQPGVNGTWIVPEEELMEKPVVTGITHRLDEARITIQGMSPDIERISKLFEVLAKEGVFLDMISQERNDEGGVNVSITVPDESSLVALETVREMMVEIGGSGVALDRDISKISVVGIGMRYHTGVAARLFKALARERIDIGMINTSEINISVVVPRKYCEVAVRALHEEFAEFTPSSVRCAVE